MARQRITVQADIFKATEGIKHGFQQAGQAFSKQIFYCRQVHGTEIADVRSLSESGRHAADGVFSGGPLTVIVITADCLLIFMSSRGGRVAATLHGGWQELVAGIVDVAVARFNACGAASVNIRVAIGPGVKAYCYEVSAGFIEALQVGRGRLWESMTPPWSQRRPLPEWPPRSAPPEPRQTEQGAWLDLVAFCRQSFQAAGVGPAQIEVSAACTYCFGDVFASHRRHQRLGGEKRQQYAWIARKP